VLLKLMLTYGKGGTRWFPSNNQWVGKCMGASLDRWGWSLSQGIVNLKCNIKSYIFYESWTFPTSSLPQNYTQPSHLFSQCHGQVCCLDLVLHVKLRPREHKWAETSVSPRWAWFL
jgi:hypothetical protein